MAVGILNFRKFFRRYQSKSKAEQAKLQAQISNYAARHHADLQEQQRRAMRKPLPLPEVVPLPPRLIRGLITPWPA